jgi:chemotaxis protein CheD
MRMTSNSKVSQFNPAVLPMEFRPKMAFASDDNHTKYYLIPGKVFATAQPFAITTIVGSGVSICLWDSANKIGGANHYTLPEGPSDGENATRYANVANPALLQRMLDLGAERKNLEARIFGGTVSGINFGGEGEKLGERNVQAAEHFLRMNGIRIAQNDIGGTHGRKLVFQSDDGKAWSEEL